MTKKNIAETNKFAEYLGIATDTLRGIMGNDYELPRRAEHKAIDMGKDGAWPANACANDCAAGPPGAMWT